MTRPGTRQVETLCALSVSAGRRDASASADALPVDEATLEGQEANGEDQANERDEHVTTDDEDDPEDAEEAAKVPDRGPYRPQERTKDEEQEHETQTVSSEGNKRHGHDLRTLTEHELTLRPRRITISNWRDVRRGVLFWSRKKVERRSMVWPHHPEVTTIERRQLANAQSLCCSDDGPIDAPEGQICVLDDELGDPEPVRRVHGLGDERPGREVPEPANLGLWSEPGGDEVRDLRDDEDRNDEWARVLLEQRATLIVMPIARVDQCVEGTRVD